MVENKLTLEKMNILWNKVKNDMGDEPQYIIVRPGVAIALLKYQHRYIRKLQKEIVRLLEQTTPDELGGK